MYRRTRGRPWLVFGGGALVLVVGILVVKWWLGHGEPDSANADSSTLQANAAGQKQPETAAPASRKQANSPPSSTPASDAGKPKQSAPSKPSGNEPVKIAMGANLPGASPKPDAGNKPVAPASESKSPATPAVTTNLPRGTHDDAPAKQDTGLTAPPPAVNPTRMPDAAVSQRVQLGLDLIKQNKPVEARKTLSDALNAPGVPPAEAQRIRDELTKLNERLVFGPDITAGDPYVFGHQIASGEALAKLPKKLGLSVDWRFLQRINQISDPARVRAGKTIKVVKGPFHAIIDKRAFRLDLYMGDFSDRVYVRSFSVGLGEAGATPEGAFVVKPDSKLVNPAWTNPRTGEYFQPDDPKNPLGEYWIGLVGASDNIRGLETYGIHGTVDPASVGKEMSMGCVRMLADDIKVIYEVLVDSVSRVEIHGNDWP